MLYEEKARAALQANLSQRYRRMDRLESYVAGTQYGGRPHFSCSDVPMYDRAPSIVYPIVRSAIWSNVDLCLGDGRWPTITTGTSEDDEAFDDAGLSEQDSETADRFIEGVAEQSRLPMRARELLKAAHACGTAVAICSVRKGRLVVDTTLAKWCKPTFDPADPAIVTSLEIRYPYLEEYQDKAESKPAMRCMLYRRVIDAEADTTFLPVKADEEGAEPPPSAWRPDPAKTMVHGFGFCPVVWHKHLAECSTVDDIDGRAIHADLLDEIDELNFGLSQRHVAAMVAASPPVIETGVDEDHNPSAMGREPTTIWLPGDDDSMRQWRPRPAQATAAARKRGPSVIWRYPNEMSKVEHLVIPGDALKPSDDDCRDIRSKLAEAMAVVFTDPENMKTAADISGRALREHHKRQVERCDSIRDDFGDGMLLPLVGMLLRICVTLGGRGQADRLRVPGLAKTLPILEKGTQTIVYDDGAERSEWEPPIMRLIWPDYFTPSESECKEVVDATLTAKDGGLITLRTAVERVKGIFGIGNVDQYVDALEKEAEKKANEAHEAQLELTKAAKGKPDQSGQAPTGQPMMPNAAQ